MARYAEIARDVMRAGAAQGRETYPVNLLVQAHAVDVIAPGQLSIIGGDFGYAGKRVSGPMDVARVLNAPGFRVTNLTMVAGSGVVPSLNPPSRLVGDFDAEDIVSDIGTANADFLEQLAELYASRLKPSGLIPVDQVERAAQLVRVGVPAFPASEAALTGAGYPLELRAPTLDSQRAEQWAKITAAFKDVVSAYNKGNVAEAARLVEAANASADMWANIQAAAEFVRDLPANAVVGAGKLAFSALGTKNLILLGVVGLGAAAFFLAPKLAAVKALVKR